MPDLNPIHRLLSIAGRRLAAVRFLSALHLGVMLAAIAAVVLALADRAGAQGFVPWLWAGTGLVAVALVFAAVRAGRTRPSELEVAVLVDEQLRLRERLSNAMQAARSEGAVARVVVEDGIAAARDPRAGEALRRRFPVRGPRRGWVGPLIAVGAVGILQLPQANLFASEPSESENEVEIAAARDTAEAAVEAVAAVLEESPELSGELADLAEELAIPEDDLERPEDVKREAIKRLTEASRKLENLLDGEEASMLDEMRERMSRLKAQDGPGAELSDAMRQGDFKRAGEELQEIINQLEAGEMSEEMREALAQNLQQMAEQIEEMAAQQKALEDALADAGLDPQLANNPQAMQQAIEQSTALNQEQKDQLQQQAQAKQQAQQAMQQMAQMMQKMAGQCQNPGGGDGQKQGQGQKGGQQGQQGQGQQGQGQQGQGQQGGQQGQGGQSGQQSGAEGLANQLSDLEQMQQMLQQAQSMLAQCQGQCQGLGMAMGGKPGSRGRSRGPGGGANPTQATAAATVMKREDVEMKKGEVIARMFVDGDPMPGESKAKALEVVRAESSGIDEAIDESPLPRKYHEAAKHYFGELQRRIEAVEVAPAPPAAGGESGTVEGGEDS